jgi:hypothetical protein
MCGPWTETRTEQEQQNEMDISIEERKFSFRSEYDISTPDSSYYAQKAFFSLGAKLQLQAEGGRVLAIIRGRFPFFTRYDFEFSNGSFYKYRCEKFWKGVFVCEGQGESYRLYQHKGRRWSIFQNDRQIAAFTKNRVTIGKGNEYDIRMNANADVLIVICLTLTLNTSENDDDNATVTIDFGNIGPEDRPFDESWEPT